MEGRRRRPEVSVRPGALRQGLERTLADVEREITQAIEEPHAPPQLLHDLHRDLRRLAGGLAVWAGLLRRRDAEELRPTLRRIRRFARLVGRVRDRDVSLGLIEPLAEKIPGEEAGELRTFIGRLREDGRTSRELLRAFLTTERRGGLLEQSRMALDRPPRPAAEDQIVRVFGDVWEAHHRAMRRAHRRARKKPNVERLHRLRIRIRRYRHLAALAELAGVPASRPVERSLRDLQGRLGRLHDLDIALSTLPQQFADSDAAQRLAGELRSERATIRRALEKRRARTPSRVQRPRRRVGGG